MVYISLKYLKCPTGRLSPEIIILRKTEYSKGKIVYFLNIPRQIATKGGIEGGTFVDILYDSDKSMLRATLIKDIHGFKVTAVKHSGKNVNLPPTRVLISFPDVKEAKLPKIKKPVIITDYEFNQGLIMRIPKDG